MVVDIGFKGVNRPRVINPPNRTVSPSRPMSADVKKLYERISEVNQRANTYKIDLDNAMNALQAANAEIDRLNGELGSCNEEIRRLNAEVCMLRQELDKASQKKGRGRRPAAPQDKQSDS